MRVRNIKISEMLRILENALNKGADKVDIDMPEDKENSVKIIYKVPPRKKEKEEEEETNITDWLSTILV